MRKLKWWTIIERKAALRVLHTGGKLVSTRVTSWMRILLLIKKLIESKNICRGTKNHFKNTFRTKNCWSTPKTLDDITQEIETLRKNLQYDFLLLLQLHTIVYDIIYHLTFYLQSELSLLYWLIVNIAQDIQSQRYIFLSCPTATIPCSAVTIIVLNPDSNWMVCTQAFPLKSQNLIVPSLEQLMTTSLAYWMSRVIWEVC